MILLFESIGKLKNVPRFLVLKKVKNCNSRDKPKKLKTVLVNKAKKN